MMKALFIVNDPPYGTERVYNALRLAHALLKKEPQTTVTIFLMADAVVAARGGQKTPDGYYNIERMLKRVLAEQGRGAPVRHLHGCPWLSTMQLSWPAPAAARWTSLPRPRLRLTKLWCSELRPIQPSNRTSEYRYDL